MLPFENAEKKMERRSFASKANALKRKTNETKQTIEKLEKRKKFYKFYNYLYVLIFCCETYRILFTTQEAITCSRP